MPNIIEYRNSIKISNERTKQLSQFINNLASASLSAGVIGGALGYLSVMYAQILNLSPAPNAHRIEQWQLDKVQEIALTAVSAFTLVSIVLFVVASLVIGRLKPE